MNLPRCIIVDLDGTLCDHRHRLHHVTRPPIDWDAFHDACPGDDPHAPIVKLVQAVFQSGLSVVLCSGRPDSHRAQTVGWLERQQVPYSLLLMRPAGDRRRDIIIKKEMLDLIRQHYEPLLAIDDRPSVIDMWRDNGLMCLAMDGAEWTKVGKV
jgi:hypothetical protein